MNIVPPPYHKYYDEAANVVSPKASFSVVSFAYAFSPKVFFSLNNFSLKRSQI